MAASNFTKFVDGYRLINGTKLNRLFTGAESLQSISVTGQTTIGGPLVNGIANVKATGASAGTARAISTTANIVYVSVTASTEGVKLPAAATGRAITIIASPTVGVKVYANAAGQSIAAGTTNTTATTVPLNNSITFQAISKTKWLVS